MTLGTRVIEWDFIVAQIGEDEGILGNDFAMAQQLTVQPHGSAVYLPASSSTGFKVLEVRALRTMTLVPRTVSQVSVVIPFPKAGRDGDGGSRARSIGIVPGARGDRDGTGQSNLGSQPQVTPNGESSDSDGGVRDGNTRDMPGG